MTIPTFWKKIISVVGTTIVGVLTLLVMDKYIAILITVLAGLIGVWFVGYGELTKEEKQRIIANWRKYKRDDYEKTEDEYFLFVGIDNKFSKSEIKVLIEEGQFTKDEYEHKKNRGACL